MIRLCLSVLLGVSLTSCNKDYTYADAKRYVKQLGVKKFESVSEEEYDEDTVWTFREKNDRGLEFHVVEDHYLTGIDTASFEASEMYADYDSTIFRYYNDELSCSGEIEYKNDSYDGLVKGAVCLEYTFTDRDTLQQCVEDIDQLFEDLYRLNRPYNKSHDSFDIWCTLTCKSSCGTYMYSGLPDQMKKADDDFLIYAMSWYDEERLSGYTESEKESCLTSHGSRILVDGELTDIMTLRGNTLIYNPAFYHLLQEYGFSPKGTPDSFTVTGVDGNTYGPFDRYVWFNDATQILGKEVKGEWQ